MRKFLLYSSALVLLSGTAGAGCIQTPSCSSLGYSSTTACEGGLKCPWGNAWFCNVGGGGSGSNPDYSNCKIGDILYSDMSCNANMVASKTPIGVVFDTTNTLAVGLDEKEIVAWSTTNFDIANLSYISNSRTDFNGKNNTQSISDYCKKNNKSCPAAEYANNYSSEGTSAGDWYLPASGEILILLDNYDLVNTGLLKAGGHTIRSIGNEGYYYYWSSSVYDSKKAYACYTSGCESQKKENDIVGESWYVNGALEYRSYTYISRPIINYKNLNGS